MDNRDNTELIEAYLNDTLPESKYKEIERRMEADPDFRKEVRLHRHLRDQLSDPDHWKHYNALAGARGKPVPPTRNVNYLKWIGLLAVLLTVGFLIWQSTNEATLVKGQRGNQGQEASPSATPDALPTDPKPKPQEQPPVQPSTTQPEQPRKNVPIAQAANFTPNAAMEDNMEGVRGGDLQASLESPKNTDAFMPSESGKTMVVFKGIIEGIANGSSQSLSLLIYNNRDNKRPVFSQRLKTLSGTSGTETFESRLRLDLVPGLYYFVISEDENEVEVHIGKFTIGKQ